MLWQVISNSSLANPIANMMGQWLNEETLGSLQARPREFSGDPGGVLCVKSTQDLTAPKGVLQWGALFVLSKMGAPEASRLLLTTPTAVAASWCWWADAVPSPLVWALGGWWSVEVWSVTGLSQRLLELLKDTVGMVD